MSNEKIFARWRDSFRAWFKDTGPRLLLANNRREHVDLAPKQWALLERLLGSAYTMALLVQPRRHGKTTLAALVILYLCSSRPNFSVGCLPNSELHGNRVQFGMLKAIIRATPALFGMVGGEAGLLQNEIRFQTTGAVIKALTPTAASSFGDRFNILWCSDFHAATDLEPFNALRASLLDSDFHLMLIDSNVDAPGGHVHQLEQAALADPGIFCDHVEYRDLAHYEAEAPPWIDRAEVRRLQKTTLPAAFARDILGKRSSATNSLFSPEVIAGCQADYKAPVSPEALKLLVGGRSYVIGCGVDRSKSLFGGDNTIVTITAKVATDSGEPEYFILQQDAIIPNTASLLKRCISRANEAYHLDNVTLENYEAVDIKPWLDDQGIACELVSAHSTNQNAIFPELHRIAKESRLHFSRDDKDLVQELQTFVYTQQKGGQYSFGHSSTKFHDDRVYSLAWSIWATRANVLNLFVMGNIQCNSKSPHRKFCFLMGGDLELLCKDECRAWHEAQNHYRDYRRLRMDDDTTTLADFFNNRVKLVGARVYQGL